MQMIFFIEIKKIHMAKKFLSLLFSEFFQKISNFSDFLWPSNKFHEFP